MFKRSNLSATASDRARLERVFERVLGSGSGSEELDVALHKDKESYVALWLYRIALDPDEGTTYTKFMRKWGIGRKYAVVYVQQVCTTQPIPRWATVRARVRELPGDGRLTKGTSSEHLEVFYSLPCASLHFQESRRLPLCPEGTTPRPRTGEVA